MSDISLDKRITILLEAERAGVFAARALLDTASESAQSDLMALILDGERKSCRILGQTLLKMDTAGTGRIGDFAQKVLAFEDPIDRIRLLIKGQEWVVRKIGEALETGPSKSFAAPLAEIRHIHDIGIGKCREYLKSGERLKEKGEREVNARIRTGR